MRFFTAISALFLSAMLSDSPSARAALLQHAGRLLNAESTECASSQTKPGVSFKVSFLQSSRFVEAAAKPAGLDRPVQEIAIEQTPAVYSLVPIACGASLHAPHRSGAPPLV